MSDEAIFMSNIWVVQKHQPPIHSWKKVKLNQEFLVNITKNVLICFNKQAVKLSDSNEDSNEHKLKHWIMLCEIFFDIPNCNVFFKSRYLKIDNFKFLDQFVCKYVNKSVKIYITIIPSITNHLSNTMKGRFLEEYWIILVF